ncbi:hypothetical protein J2753_000491 [Halolamina salifodinae]|uniref:Uncharacterized protein n=1 Tax=Halolamina salifodinae TaxID=1202767 RepID=A0A8T4GXS5_9EURY|nr:hypothetical protein [Halolamina salifodinae]
MALLIVLTAAVLVPYLALYVRFLHEPLREREIV